MDEFESQEKGILKTLILFKAEEIELNNRGRT